LIVTQKVCLLTFLVVLVSLALAQAQTFTTLYKFTGGADGGYPDAGVIQDLSGNLYGTTEQGGDLGCATNGCGVVYEVSADGSETVLHTFDGSDGKYPITPLAQDKAGNLYGTAYLGGTAVWGAVFRIDAAGNETVLHNFTGGSDGCVPEQGLVLGKSGTVFGTTSHCGPPNKGTIFKVDSAGKFTRLHIFVGARSDAGRPVNGRLTIDRSGNLYGSTYWGGAHGQGTVYKLSRAGRLTLLYSFAGGASDGCHPYGSVVRDEAGNLYGTTYRCGSDDWGTIWKVSRKGKETILHNFTGFVSDGCLPVAGVNRDSKGNLYGVASGCAGHSYGALYELSTSGKLTLLHSFDGTDGAGPRGEVLRTPQGMLFGTSTGGGTHGYGTVWKYVP
jgi:uncharacterized repeat protein (TIGR03803 family)